jgi:hypothetical protein
LTHKNLCTSIENIATTFVRFLTASDFWKVQAVTRRHDPYRDASISCTRLTWGDLVYDKDEWCRRRTTPIFGNHLLGTRQEVSFFQPPRVTRQAQCHLVFCRSDNSSNPSLESREWGRRRHPSTTVYSFLQLFFGSCDFR